MRSDMVIVLKDVTKSFGGKKAVDGINLVVHRGEVCGFLGPNGAGKTTTIRLLLSVLRPDQGQIVLFGNQNLTPQAAHKRIGFLSGDMAMDDDLTGRQHLQFIDAMYGGGHMQYALLLADKLQAKLDTRIGAYSRGNRQKIALIAAMMHKPELLILDEPTSGFDPIIQDVFAGLLREYRDGGGTVFMSSHILSEVQQLCDRVAFIRDGKLAGTKSMTELAGTSARMIRVKGADAAKLKLAGLRPRQHEKGTYTFSGDIKRFVSYIAAKDITDLTITEPELEDAFMHYYSSPEAQE